MKACLGWIAAFGLLAAAAPGARADELKLKDGTKLSGTIIGFDDNSFKVKTNYGYAMVQKDQVVSIVIADVTNKPELEKKKGAEKKPEPPAEKASAAAKTAKTETADAASPPESVKAPDSKELNDSPAPAIVAKPEAPSKLVAKSTAAMPASAAPTSSSSSEKAGASPAPASSSPAVAKAAPPPAAPAPQPEVPEPVREEVNGNTYINKTFGFQMYKPPTWQVIEGARSLLPGAITAMGTADQSTYLLIGHEPAGKSLAGDIDETEQRLREILGNYRPLGEKRISVSGAPVTERRFRGSVDRRDWSGVVVFIPRDTHLYTIFAMTVADTDLVQIQENVIARTISSFQFTKQ